MKRALFTAIATGAFATLLPVVTYAFELSSPDLREGERLGTDQVYDGYGCAGANRSPALQWKDVPEGTRSFAVTVFDPDAPTGSGWWHWIVYDIPASATGLSAGLTAKALPGAARQGRNDFGVRDFGGACPPPGKPHRYVFTVYALGKDALGVPEDVSAAAIGFNLRAASLGQASITATYGR